jgi:hypothetical protein
MIYLEKDSFIAKGSNRYVYLHKNFPNKCIKIVPEEIRKKIKLEHRNKIKKLLPLNFFGENEHDKKYYKVLNKKAKQDPDIFKYIPKMYEIVDTNIGEGLVFDYIDNSINLVEYIVKFNFNDFVVNELKFFFKILLKNNIQLSDYSCDNFLVKKDCDGKNVSLKLIDGLGLTHFIPFFHYNTYFGRKYLKKRIKRFLNSSLFLELQNSTTPQLHNSTTPQLHNSTTPQLHNKSIYIKKK